MLYESFKVSPRGPPPGNTCASMGKLRKLGPKTLHMSEFVGHFSEIFRRPLGGCFVIPLMFFDALKVLGPSQSDPGPIWETLIFHENSQNFCPDVNLKSCRTPARSVRLS